MAYGRTIRDAIAYGFSVGRVRVLEGRLLSNAALERLVDAEDFLAQKRVLADTEFASWMAPTETATDVEEALDGYLSELYAFLETSGLAEEVVRFFRTGSDHRNMKGRLKAEVLDVPLEGLLEAHGQLDVALFSGPVEMLPKAFRDLDAEVRGPDGAVDRMLVDPVVDRAMYEDMLAAAEEAGCELLTDIARLDVDLTNVLTVLRSKRLGWTVEQVTSALVVGGSFDPIAPLSAYNQSFADLAERLASAARLPGVTVDDLIAVERFDVLADDVLMHRVRTARLTATGVEPVIGYIVARRSEVVILRTLLVGKIGGLSASALRSRVRELYV